MKNIAVLVSGSGTNLQSLIDQAEKGTLGGSIRLVVSNREDAYALERARRHGIEAQVLTPKRLGGSRAFNLALVELLRSRGIDLVVLAGFMSILAPETVAAFRDRILNIHPSLIPSFCGKGFHGIKVHEAVLEYGAKVSGATVHLVDEGTDTGPIVAQRSVEVLPGDSPERLQARVLAVEHELLPACVRAFCQGRLRVEQVPGKRPIVHWD